MEPGTARRRIRELESMVPGFVDRIGGSKCVQAQPVQPTFESGKCTASSNRFARIEVLSGRGLGRRLSQKGGRPGVPPFPQRRRRDRDEDKEDGKGNLFEVRRTGGHGGRDDGFAGHDCAGGASAERQNRPEDASAQEAGGEISDPGLADHPGRGQLRVSDL